MPSHLKLQSLKKKLHFIRFTPFDTSTPEGRSLERQRRIALSSGASALAKLISIATGLISIPLTLGYLGPERYGMWLIIVSFSALFSFADLGMGNGVLNQVSYAYGRDDEDTIHRVVSSGYGVLTLIALLVLMIFSIAYPFVHWYKIFNVASATAQAEAGPAIAAFVTCFALAIPLGIVQKVQMGLQRSFLTSLWQCGSSLMSLAGVLIVIYFHGNLMWLVIAFMGAPLIASLLNSVLFFGHMLPRYSPKPSMVSFAVIDAITRTGVLFLGLQFLYAVANYSDSLVIAQVLGVSAVPIFAIPERLFGVIAAVIMMMLAPIWPAYGESWARGEIKWIKAVLKKTMMLSTTAALLGSTMLIMAFPFLLHIWVHDAVHPPIMLLLGFGAWKVVEAAINSMTMFLNGTTVIAYQLKIGVITAISAVVLKIVFAFHFGVAGTIWATIISYSVFTFFPCILKIKSILNKKMA